MYKTGRRIVLASASPRRRDLLSLLGIPFLVDASDIEEHMDLSLPPGRLARRLALQKARAVGAKYDDAVVIAADTLISHKGHVLGKPRGRQDAVRMLRMLSASVHSVITGFAVIDTAKGRTVSRAVETRVWFRRLSPAEIRAYVETDEPMDKAGAYAIQGRGLLIVRKIDGDYANVVGLPVAAVAACLREFGVRLP